MPETETDQRDARATGFVAELRRRNVFRVAATYAVAAWLVVQVADATFDVLGISAAIHRIVVLLALAGFPVALILGWIFDWTSEGVVRTADVDGTEPPLQRRRRVDVALASIAALAVSSLVWLGWSEMESASARESMSVVVLPFDDLSPERDRAYFAQGMSEELTNVLGRLPSLRVFGRTSAEAAKREGMDAARIHETMGADAIVEGSVRRLPDRVRVSVQLVEATTGNAIWSETYDRPVDDLFDLQSQLATDVAGALDLRLRAAASAPPTRNLAAYDAYLTGRHLLGRQTPEMMVAAEDAFRQAVRTDPDFALAWSGLSDVLSLSWAVGFVRDPSYVDRAFEAAERAVQADPESAEAQTSLARTLWMKRDWRAAEAALTKAIDSNPGYAFAYQSLALVLMNLGEFERGLAASHRSVDLDPLSPYMFVNLSTSYDAARDHDNAARFALRARDLEPQNPVAQGMLVMNLLYAGRNDEAYTEFVAFPPAGLDPPEIAELKSAGPTAVWSAMLAWWDGQGFPCGGPAGPIFYAQLDRTEEALGCLEWAIDLPGIYANIYVAHSAGLAPLEGEPRYRAALTEMGLPTEPL